MFLFQVIQFCQSALIQAIQFTICIGFIYTKLDVKTVLFQTIQFSMQKQLNFEQFSLA